MGLRYSEDMLISRFRCRSESPRDHAREEECRVCHYCGIKSMSTSNDLKFHACLRDKVIAFQHTMKDHITALLHWKECSRSLRKSAERSSLPSPYSQSE